MRLFTKRRTGAQAAGAGRLNLALSGFTRQEMVALDDIVRALDRLPDFHLQGLREIAYVPDGAPFPEGLMPYPVYPHCDPRGEFVQEERRIFVYGFDSPRMFFHMLHHEVGHFVFFLALSSAVKKLWVTDLAAAAPWVTDYAASSPWEDFAESYAYYALHPRRLEREAPEKHAFMRDCVFSGHPATLKERMAGC
jgi:hypothetical protein